MPTLRFETTVSSPLADVWSAFQDVYVLLPSLTPPAQKLVIESADPLPPRVGTIVVLSVKGPLGRTSWTARYTAFDAPHATVTGVEARFVDEQVAGPFKRFVQSHEFEAASDRTTRCVDVIDYAAPFGPLGALADVIFLRRLLTQTFAHRHRQLVARFGPA